jgi:hypothetical protein
MTNTLLRNLDLFRKLCGDDTLSNIRLVTTNWDMLPDKNEGKRIEQELCEEYWKPFISSGAQVHRFHYSCASAWEIVNSLPMDRKPIQIQKELVDQNKPLSQTTAGQSLFYWASQSLRDLIARLELLIKKVMSSSSSSGIPQSQWTKKRLKELSDAREDLRRIEIQSQQSPPLRRPSWRRRKSPTIPLGSSDESTLPGSRNSSLSSWRIVTHKIYDEAEGSLRRRKSHPREHPPVQAAGTISFEAVRVIPPSPQNSICDIPDADSLYEVATGADIVATGTLTYTIQTLRTALASVIGLPVPGLAAAIGAALRVAELLKVSSR